METKGSSPSIMTIATLVSNRNAMQGRTHFRAVSARKLLVEQQALSSPARAMFTPLNHKDDSFIMIVEGKTPWNTLFHGLGVSRRHMNASCFMWSLSARKLLENRQ